MAKQNLRENTLIQDLTTGSVPRQLITFAAPLFLSGLLQTAYSMVDMAVVGHFLGSSGLSAVSVGADLMSLLMFIAMGLSNAGQMIISQYIGAGYRDKLKRVIGTLFTFLLGLGLVLSIACLLLRRHALGWLNTPPEALDMALDYVVVCSFGLLFTYGYNLVSAILRGMGDSRHPFIFIAIASVLNIVLDLLFVAGLDMSAFGAALATILSQGVSFLCALVFLYRNREKFGFDFRLRSFGLYPDVLKPLLKLGIPMMLQSAAITFSKLFVASHINAYGVVASAVTGIGNKIQLFTNVFAQALSTAGGTMIAQNIGAEKYQRVPRVIGTSCLVNGCIALLLSVITALWPKAVFGLFTSDPAVLEMSLEYVPVAVLIYASCVLRPPMNALINGSGNSKLNLCIGLLDGLVVRIGLAMLLGQVLGWGISGYWYGNALSSFMPFFIGGTFYISGRWKTRKYILGKD